MKAALNAFIQAPPDCELPTLIAPIARTVGAHFGVPPPTIALLALNVLGGLISAACRLEFLRDLHPLGLHLVVLTPATPEAARFEDLILEPVIDEICRLRELGAEKPDAARQYADLGLQLAREPTGSPASIILRESIRELGPTAHPNMIIRGLPDGEVIDGLGSPICRFKISNIEKDGLLERIAATHTDQPGRTLTVWASSTAEELRDLAQTPLLSAPCGWPLLALPASGAAMSSVPNEELDAARKRWSDLVRQALVLRYGPLKVIELNPESFGVVTKAKEMAEEIAARSQTFFGASAMVSTVLRLGATLHALTNDVNAPVAPASLNEVLSLTSWAAGFSAKLKPNRGSAIRLKRYPAKPTLEGDLEKVRRVIENHPNLSVRNVRRKLPSRPPGHWSLLIRSARGDFKPNFAAKFAAIAAETATAKDPR